jgi:NAD(P)-dependent dehydrogenase (short-subunit alcohol dehydrogenase family)
VSGRIALVTGSAGGLGRAIVQRLADDGWQVAAATHREGAFAADLADPAQARQLVARVVQAFGRLDLLVINHARMSMAPVEQHPIEDWWQIVDTNLGGAFFLSQAGAPYLRDARGSIVVISSEWGVIGWPNASAYASSKAGLIGLTRSLARELAPLVRVNAIAPGVIDTPQLNVDAEDLGITLDEVKARYAAATPLGRIGSPEEIATTVSFLASPSAGWYTGQVLHPNGGTTMAS